MSKKGVFLLTLLFVLPVILYFLWPTDSSRIKRLFSEGAEAVERQNVEEVMSKVAYTYHDERGLSYLILRDMLKKIFGQFADIRIEYHVGRIEIRDKVATAEVDLRVVATHGADTGYFIGDAARPARLTFSLEKERATWYIGSSRGLPAAPF